MTLDGRFIAARPRVARCLTTLLICGALISPAAVRAGTVDVLAPGEALDLGAFGIGAEGVSCSSADNIFDYSRITYVPVGHRMLVFGGGHASTPRTDVVQFDFESLSWSSAYPSTPESAMTPGNLDRVAGRWISTNHPTARHSWDAIVFAPNVGALIHLGANDGTPSSSCPDYGVPYHGTRIAHYDPTSTTWRFTEASTVGLSVAAAWDPMSGMVVALKGSVGLTVYDPVAETRTDYEDFIGQFETGASYSPNLVYFPDLLTDPWVTRDQGAEDRCLQAAALPG